MGMSSNPQVIHAMNMGLKVVQLTFPLWQGRNCSQRSESGFSLSRSPMSSTATLVPIAIGDLTVQPFPIEGMTCASCVFGEHWALNDLFWAFSYNVVANALTLRRWKGDRP